MTRLISGMTTARILCVAATLFATSHSPLAAQSREGAALLAEYDQLQWRNIGPFRGGRASAVAGTADQPHTLYMGTPGGGLWKTINAGQSWTNISDGFFKTPSVGHVDVAPSNPDIVYVGMGESAVRANTTHHGDGVYKSTDGGKMWRHMGLEATQVISRVRVHPRNPDVVYVGAQGAQYAPTQERGVYRSRDGGATWTRVLFVAPTSGIADLIMDPTNPEVLYASVWDHQRFPWGIEAFGRNSGVYKTTNGGDTWQRLGGLPAIGKSSVTMSVADPSRLYLLAASREPGKGGLYRSNDGGSSWTLVNATPALTGRSWYYTKVFADPTNADNVWVAASSLRKSTDGGRTFSVVTTAHPDVHELWINPTDSKLMGVADDGGVSMSLDGGVLWSSQNIYATAQIYRLELDNRYPYWVYGGQQDNTSVAIPSGSVSQRGIGNAVWYPIGGYEMSTVAVDPDNPDLTYASNNGGIDEYSQTTRVNRSVGAFPLNVGGNSASPYAKYRFDLQTPLFMSRHTKTLYLSAQKLLASDDRGTTWREVSPDLTRRGNEPGRDQHHDSDQLAEDDTYGAIHYAAESPARAGILWTGSDDGYVGITRDGGRTWHKTGLPGVGDARIYSIDPSPHDAAVAYLAATRHQFNDYAPYFFKTADYGRTWKRIGAGLPMGAWARVIREDPRRKGLLYAGTELGAYVSFDDGTTWVSLQRNLPISPVYDLKVHQGDIVVSTGGRSIWILDDILPLSDFTPATAAAPAHLFRTKTAYRSNVGARTGWEGGVASFGTNPITSAVIQFRLAQQGPVSIDIVNPAGRTVRRFATAGSSDPRATIVNVRQGFNRVLWDLRETSPAPSGGGRGGGGGQGLWAAPGTYTVQLTAAGRVLSTPLVVRPQPGSKATAADYAAQEQFFRTLQRDLAEMRDLTGRATSVRSQLSAALPRLTDSSAAAVVRTYLEKLAVDPEVMTHMNALSGRANGLEPHIGQPLRETFQILHGKWLGQKRQLTAALGTDLAALNAVLARSGAPAIAPTAPPGAGGRGGTPQ